MKKQNTTIAKSTDGWIYIDFQGSESAKSCYAIVDHRGFIKGTYNRKSRGNVSPGMELSSQVKKAINQKWDRKKQCDVIEKHYYSIMDALKGELNVFMNGDLAANGQILD